MRWRLVRERVGARSRWRRGLRRSVGRRWGRRGSGLRPWVKRQQRSHLVPVAWGDEGRGVVGSAFSVTAGDVEEFGERVEVAVQDSGGVVVILRGGLPSGLERLADDLGGARLLEHEEDDVPVAAKLFPIVVDLAGRRWGRALRGWGKRVRWTLVGASAGWGIACQTSSAVKLRMGAVRRARASVIS